MAYLRRYLAGGEIYVVPPEFVFHHSYGEVGGPTAPPLAGASARAAARRRYERRKTNTVGKRYRLADVAERDGFRCHICGKRVNMTLSGRHPMGPTADHLIPVSANGGDEPENIALAHSTCNVHRGVGGVAQLRLVG